MGGQHHDVLAVDLADGLVELGHARGHVRGGGPPRLIERVEGRDDGLVLVARGNLLPQPFGAILILAAGPVFVLARTTGVVIGGLATHRAVQIKNDVNAAFLGLGNRPVQVFPGVRAQRLGLVLVLNHAPQNRQAHQVEAEGLELIPVALLHPVVAKQRNQALLLGVAQALGQLALQRALVDDAIAALTHHPEFLDQPIAQIRTLQFKRRATRPDPLCAVGTQEAQVHGGRRRGRRDLAPGSRERAHRGLRCIGLRLLAGRAATRGQAQQSQPRERAR